MTVMQLDIPMHEKKIRALMHEQFAIPVLRHENAEVLISMARALALGGLKVIEITLMSTDADRAIEILKDESGLTIGAGTVTGVIEFERAERAGARFFVSPGWDEKLIEHISDQEHFFIPGVCTPSEVMRAKNMGYDFVKIFPSGSLGGASYLKTLSGPFPKMKWMATGGVAAADIASYLEADAFAIGLGSYMTPAAIVKNGNWAELTRMAQACCAEIASAREKQFKKNKA
jgi:2-dehydro-3-deoxyphosphogluconate aldolase/(4S)-4-hydroxy-2-oxoglutarate aldolase